MAPGYLYISYDSCSPILFLQAEEGSHQSTLSDTVPVVQIKTTNVNKLIHS
ncbi:hypothetical protein Hanom_Chr15g01369551 [Helianthus anomalus]